LNVTIASKYRTRRVKKGVKAEEIADGIVPVGGIEKSAVRFIRKIAGNARRPGVTRARQHLGRHQLIGNPRILEPDIVSQNDSENTPFIRPYQIGFRSP